MRRKIVIPVPALRAPGGDCPGRFRAAEEEDHQADRIPERTVSPARRGHHPQADPARRVPVIDAAHQSLIAMGDEGQHSAHGISGNRDANPIRLLIRRL